MSSEETEAAFKTLKGTIAGSGFKEEKFLLDCFDFDLFFREGFILHTKDGILKSKGIKVKELH